MERPRLHIATMLGLVLFCGVGLAAIRYASNAWARTCFSLALGVLGSATLPLLLLRGARRAYWVGFNALGWGYLVACFGPWCEVTVRPHLVTTWAIEELAPYVVHPRILTYEQPDNGPFALLPGSVLATPAERKAGANGKVLGSEFYWSWPAVTMTRVLGPGDPGHVQRIGHSLLALVAAATGGVAARRWAVPVGVRSEIAGEPGTVTG